MLGMIEIKIFLSLWLSLWIRPILGLGYLLSNPASTSIVTLALSSLKLLTVLFSVRHLVFGINSVFHVNRRPKLHTSASTFKTRIKCQSANSTSVIYWLVWHFPSHCTLYSFLAVVSMHTLSFAFSFRTLYIVNFVLLQFCTLHFIRPPLLLAFVRVCSHFSFWCLSPPFSHLPFLSRVVTFLFDKSLSLWTTRPFGLFLWIRPQKYS